MPYDPVSLLVAAGAGALMVAAAAWRAAAARIGVVLLAAFLIRMDAGWTRSLHPWDERFHALVAKNLLTDPLTPTLYRNPAVEYDYSSSRTLRRCRGSSVLVWIPLAAVTVAAIRDNAPELRTLLAWVAVPYVVFSATRTQLPGYVMPAAPALFLIQAYFWSDLRLRLAATSGRWRRAPIIALLVVLTVLPARYLLEPTGAFERRDRSPAAFRELRTLESRLQLPDAVIFNMPMPIEAMFYSPYTAYRQMPTDDQVRVLAAQGRTVVIYEADGTLD